MTRYSLIGATLIDESFINDIAILRINEPIPPHFKPFYSGWTALPFTSFSGAFFDIHHAAGDIKKLAVHHLVALIPSFLLVQDITLRGMMA